MMENPQWLTIFRDAQVKNLSIIRSDHGPILLLIDCWRRTGKYPPFKFKGKWLLQESFCILYTNLRKFIKRSCAYQLARKIELLKKKLRFGEKTCYSKEFHFSR